MYPFTNNQGWADDGVGRGFDAYPRVLLPRYHVYCLSCFAWLGQSTARLEDTPQEWKCNICRRVTYPNTRAYLHRLEGKGKVLHD